MIDLVARLRLKDDMTNPLKRVTKRMDETSRASQNVTSSVGKQGRALGGLAKAVGGVVAAYATATGAAKLFEATIGQAMQLEASTVAIDAIFNDKSASNAYMDLVKKMSIDSPVLSQNEMLSSSKGLIAMTKNVDELGKAWSIVEKLQVLDPSQGTDGAAFALKEMWSGDSLSMQERFGLNKGELNRIKKLDIPSQIAEINKLLGTMGITDEAVKRMGETSSASWNGVKERFQSFMQTVGSDGNTTLGKFFRRINDYFDSSNAIPLANKMGDVLNSILTKAIEVGKFLWKWREPIGYIVGALAVATTALVGIAAIAAIGVELIAIASGIGGAAIAFIAMYKNSEKFRGTVNKIIGRVKALYKVFQTSGTGGLLDAMFGDGTAEKVAGIVDTIKAKIGELKPGFEIVKNALAQGWELLNDVFTNAWNIIGPILSALWDVLQVVGDVAIIVFNNVIAPALSFLMQLFSTLWAIAQPILELLASKFEMLGGAIKWLWDNILAPLVEFILTGVKNAFDTFTEVLQIVEGAFDSISGVISSVQDKISEFTGMLSSVKLPDWITNGVSTTVSFVSDKMGGGGKSHYFGIDDVPYDGYCIAA